MRFDEGVDGYWLSRGRELSQHTVDDYSRTFARFGKFVRNVDIAKIQARHANQYLTYLTDELELAPKTVLNAWIALSSFWTWASAELGVPHIMRDVRRPKANRRTMQPYTEDEVRALLRACAHMRAWAPKMNSHTDGRRPTMLRDVAIILVLVDSGLRVGELCALRRRDYDRKTGRLIVEHGKGDKMRTVFLGQSAQRALWRYLVERGDVDDLDPLFASSSTGEAFGDSAVRLMIVRCGQRAGVAGATPHRFRHTFAINFLRNGGNLAALQDLLGHSTLEMVRRYARLAEVDLREAQKRASPADKWRL